MTTQRDLETAAETGNARREPLKICPKCGWYAHEPYNTGRCRPGDGAIADQLIAGLPEIRSGKLGYGSGKVIFDIDEGTTVVFDISNNAFSLNHVCCLHSFGHESAKDLVRAIASAVKVFTREPKKPDRRQAQRRVGDRSKARAKR